MRLPAQLLQRRPDAHKGDFGHIFVLAGSARFSGAAVLCASAAMRAGAGLVTIGIPQGINNAIIRIKPEEAMTLPLLQTRAGTIGENAYKEIKKFAQSVDKLVIGPGLSQNTSTQRLIRKVITGINKAMVIDADGLNALAGHLDILRKPGTVNREAILTPHPGEMARLSGASVARVQASRIELSKEFAKAHKVVLVLKGQRTVVADHAGNTYINKTGNPGMASAGSGDVLAGMIAAFLGQGLTAFEAAKYAVYLHGVAGDLAAKEKTQLSLIASDIIEEIPQAIKRCN